MDIRIFSDGTTFYPLQKIGVRAGVCWGSDTLSVKKNIERAQECIFSNHGRTLEFVDIEFFVSGASARVIRELYTHIGGMPTRLQESTRYVNMSNFGYYTPPKIKNNEECLDIYKSTMETITKAYSALLELGIPREDVANLLPLGMDSKVLVKMNLRSLVNLFNVRLCTRAYIEFREMVKILKKELSQLNDEWKWISDRLFVPKCEVNNHINSKMNYCTESNSCGRHPKLKDKNIP